MIEPTDEMRIIVLGWRSRYGALADDVLTELFAIVERDYDVRPRPTAGDVTAAPDSYVIDRHPDGTITTRYVGAVPADETCARVGCGHVAAQHRDSCVGDLMFCTCPGFMRDPATGR